MALRDVCQGSCRRHLSLGSGSFATQRVASSHSFYHNPIASSSRLASTSSATSTSGPHELAFPSHLANPGPYDVFHLPTSASQSQVKARYYELVKLLHPDRRLGPATERKSSNDSTASTSSKKGKCKAKASTTEAEVIADEFRKVVKAYELLSDKRKRSAYDSMGLGWDPDSSSSSDGSFGPTDSEWSELQRRGARGGRRSFSPGGFGSHPYDRFRPWNAPHDATGWQRHAQYNGSFYTKSAGPRSMFNEGPAGAAWGWEKEDFFYDQRQRDRKPVYTTNTRFISLIAIVSWSLAIFQFHRLSNQSVQANVTADKRHLDAVQSLEEARRRARSEEGKERFEALKRRAKLVDQGEGVESEDEPKGMDHLMMLPAPSTSTDG